MNDGFEKAPAQSIRELIVWQKSVQLATTLFRLTESFPQRKMYGLSSQIRRSAISVPSNIAEGQGRLTTGEFRHFLGIARGSNFEIQTQLENCPLCDRQQAARLATDH